MKKQQISALILAVFFLCVLIVLPSMLSCEPMHHCADEDCRICALINSGNDLLKAVFVAAVLGMALPVLSCSGRFFPAETCPHALRGTLVTQKVELLN